MSNPQVEAYLIHSRKSPELRGVRLSEAYEPSNISAVDEVVPLIRQSDHIVEVGKMVALLRHIRANNSSGLAKDTQRRIDELLESAK